MNHGNDLHIGHENNTVAIGLIHHNMLLTKKEGQTMSKENENINRDEEEYEYETNHVVERMAEILKDPTKGKHHKRALFNAISELKNSEDIVKGIVASLWGVGEQGKEITVNAIEAHKTTIDGFLKRVNDKENPPNEKEMSKLLEEIDKLNIKIERQSNQREKTFRHMISVLGAVAMVAVGGIVGSKYIDSNKDNNNDEYL